MSEIEATITRIKGCVKGHWITDSKGTVVRSHYVPPTGDLKEDKEQEGSQIVSTVLNITEKAQILVRDIDPSNELIFMRIKTKNDEIMVAPDKEFKLIALQSTNLQDKKDIHNH